MAKKECNNTILDSVTEFANYAKMFFDSFTPAVNEYQGTVKTHEAKKVINKKNKKKS